MCSVFSEDKCRPFDHISFPLPLLAVDEEISEKNPSTVVMFFRALLEDTTKTITTSSACVKFWVRNDLPRPHAHLLLRRHDSPLLGVSHFNHVYITVYVSKV